jgi:segregation and condensation protein B
MEKPLKLIIEALLFASPDPLSQKEMGNCLPEIPMPEIKDALAELQVDYQALDRSFTVEEVAGGFHLRTKSFYAPYILKMLRNSPARLSRAALETLAIVAYKQPVIRQEIERIRGVDAGGVLRTLLEKNLVKIMGRKAIPGRPLIYGTTRRFLEVFDLKDLESLPKLKEISDLIPSMESPHQTSIQEQIEQEKEGKDEKLQVETRQDERNDI